MAYPHSFFLINNVLFQTTFSNLSRNFRTKSHIPISHVYSSWKENALPPGHTAHTLTPLPCEQRSLISPRRTRRNDMRELCSQGTHTRTHSPKYTSECLNFEKGPYSVLVSVASVFSVQKHLNFNQHWHLQSTLSIKYDAILLILKTLFKSYSCIRLYLEVF